MDPTTPHLPRQLSYAVHQHPQQQQQPVTTGWTRRSVDACLHPSHHLQGEDAAMAAAAVASRTLCRRSDPTPRGGGEGRGAGAAVDLYAGLRQAGVGRLGDLQPSAPSSSLAAGVGVYPYGGQSVVDRSSVAGYGQQTTGSAGKRCLRRYDRGTSTVQRAEQLSSLQLCTVK